MPKSALFTTISAISCILLLTLPHNVYTKPVIKHDYLRSSSGARDSGKEDENSRELQRLFPEMCAHETLDHIMRFIRRFPSDRAFLCLKFYFEALGEASVPVPVPSPVSIDESNSTDSSNLTDTSTTTDFSNSSDTSNSIEPVLESTLTISMLDGEYIGNMIWFNGTDTMKKLVNRIWKGMDCDGNGTCNTTSIISTPSDVGIVSYEDPCPELDDYPCLKIDLTDGPIPRFYYTRQVKEGLFLSFVHTQDGSNTYSDVNLLGYNGDL